MRGKKGKVRTVVINLYIFPPPDRQVRFPYFIARIFFPSLKEFVQCNRTNEEPLRDFHIHSDNVVMFQDSYFIYAIPYSIKINSKFSISKRRWGEWEQGIMYRLSRFGPCRWCLCCLWHGRDLMHILRCCNNEFLLLASAQKITRTRINLVAGNVIQGTNL